MTLSDSESTFTKKGNKSGFWKKYQRRTGAGGYPLQKQRSLLKNPGKINNLNKHQVVFLALFLLLYKLSQWLSLHKKWSFPLRISSFLKSSSFMQCYTGIASQSAFFRTKEYSL